MESQTELKANKVTTHDQMVAGVKIKMRKLTWEQATQLEKANYDKQFGRGDKRNWGQQ